MALVSAAHARARNPLRAIPSPPDTTAPRPVAGVVVSYARAQRHERSCWMAARSSRALRPRAPTRAKSCSNPQQSFALRRLMADARCQVPRPGFASDGPARYGHACRTTPRYAAPRRSGHKLLLLAILPPGLARDFGSRPPGLRTRRATVTSIGSSIDIRALEATDAPVARPVTQ